jgi:hypothetical protein
VCPMPVFHVGDASIDGPSELRGKYDYDLWRWDRYHQCESDRSTKLRVSEWRIRLYRQ